MAMTDSPDRRTADERAMAEVVHQLRAENKTLELRNTSLRRKVRWQNAVVCGLAFLAYTGMYACRIYGEESALARRCPEPLTSTMCRDFARGYAHAGEWRLDALCPHPAQHMVLTRDQDFTLVKCLCDRQQTDALKAPR